MRLLIIGASGLVGNSIREEAAKQNHTVLGTYLTYSLDDLKKLDYGDEKEVKAMLNDFLPDIVICPAGKTNVDWIEQNPEEGYKINVLNLNILLKVCASRDIPFAFFSSDYIFDGKSGPYKEEDIPNPLNYYGKHKLECETMIKTLIPKKYFIFRTTWVFGYEAQEKNFVYSVVKNLNLGKEMKAPKDMFSTPSYSLDVAKSVIQIINKGSYGTFNVTGDEYISRYNFAKKIATVFGLDTSLLLGVYSDEMKLIATRPLKAGLVNKNVKEITKMNFTPLENALLQTKTMVKKEKIVPSL